jgi:hypothetical protein
MIPWRDDKVQVADRLGPRGVCSVPDDALAGQPLLALFAAMNHSHWRHQERAV